MSRLRRALLPLALLLGAAALHAQPAGGGVAVIYPRADNEAVRKAYLAVVEGVRAELGGRAELQEVPETETAAAISARIATRQLGGAVLLGRYGLGIARELDPAIDRVIGAVPAGPAEVPAGARGISTIPSPRALFGTLRELAPAVQRITVVHGSDANDWLVELAGSDAKAMGYGFTAERRETLRDGAIAYRELVEQKLQSPADALWLPQGSPFLAESSVLQMILRAAWDRNIVVFSSNGSHVPKGALFALYPDNEAMGRALGRMAATAAAPGAGLQPLEQLDTAINIRTANHLGLKLNAQDPRFDLVFPSR